MSEANFVQVSAICFVCGKTKPGMLPPGWEQWQRISTPLPYFLTSCPEHSTHEGLWPALEKGWGALGETLTRERLDALIVEHMPVADSVLSLQGYMESVARLRNY